MMSWSRATTPAPFVGRGVELAALRALLPAVRLVSVLGPPGVGKSRLVRELSLESSTIVSWQLGETLDSDAALLKLADELGLSPSGPASALTQKLGRTLARLDRALLIIDDAEAAIGSFAPLLDEFLAAAPELTAIATSRRPVGLASEQRFELGPLPIEDGVALFVARASAASRHFREDATDPAVLRTLVERLDGLPLAIELCAGRSAVLDPAAMLVELGDRFSVLVGSDGGRHRSLHDALVSAWRDLPAPARAILVQLTAFGGTFAADEVVDVVDAVDGVDDLTAQLTLLGAHGWLHVETEAGARRLRLLDSVREFAIRAGGDPIEVEAARRRHASAVLARAEHAACSIAERGDPAALDDLARAQTNLGLAHQYAMTRSDHETAVRLLIAWDARYTEHARPQAHIAQLEAAPQLPGLTPRTAARVHLARAAARVLSGRIAEATSDAAIAGLLAEAAGLRDIVGDAALFAAELSLHRLRPDEAERSLEALAGASEVQHARAMRIRAMIASQRGDTERALEQMEEAVGFARRLRHVLLELAVLQRRVNLHCAAAELAGAQAALHAFAERLTDHDLPRMSASVLEMFGLLALVRGRGDEAQRHYEQALAAFEILGDWRTTPCNAGLAASYVISGRPESALRVLELALPSDVPIAHVELMLTRAVARARSGDLEGARRDLSRASRDAGSAGDAVTLATALVDLAEGFTLRVTGRLSDATALVERARAASQRGHAGSDTAWIIARELARELTAWERHSADHRSETGVVVAEDGSWFEVSGKRVELGDKPLLSRLLGALASLRRAERVGVTELFVAGWPGETARLESQKNRVWVAIARLRALGLRDAMTSDKAGYYLHARVIRDATI